VHQRSGSAPTVIAAWTCPTISKVQVDLIEWFKTDGTLDSVGSHVGNTAMLFVRGRKQMSALLIRGFLHICADAGKFELHEFQANASNREPLIHSLPFRAFLNLQITKSYSKTA
jgi:hypothetical protein